MRRTALSAERRLASKGAGVTISALQQQWCRPDAAGQRRPRSARAERRSAGFTIVELMIATVVFSLVLLVITFGVIHFTNAYYKGINSSTTQTTAQNIIDTVTQNIQFSAGGTTPSDNTHFCAGGKLFVYSLGQKLAGNPTAGNRGLYMSPASGDCSDPGGLPAGGVELLASNMRLADVSVTEVDPSTNVWQVRFRIVYGDDDLLRSPSGATPAYGAKDAICKSQTGSQFCSVATVSTIAKQRIQ